MLHMYIKGAHSDRLTYLLIHWLHALAQGDSRRLRSQRAVDIDRDIRDFSFLRQLLEIIQQHLGTPHCKGGNDYIAAPLHRIINDLRQLGFLIIGLVGPVPVGGFRRYKIGPVQDRRVFHNGLVRLPHVPGEDHLCLFSVLFHFQAHYRAA